MLDVAEILYRVALRFDYGLGGVQQDSRRARRFYRLAEKKGSRMATSTLALLHFTSGDERKRRRALNRFDRLDRQKQE